MRRITFAAAIAAAAIALAGCASGAAPAGIAGTWSAEKPSTGDTPSLTLGTDGTVSGTDGCNNLAGNWTASGTTVTFSALAETLKFCDGVDAWLGGATTATVDGDTLTIHSADGSAIGDLTRAG